MPKFAILNTQAKPVGEIELADAVFAAEMKPHLHWEIVRNQLAGRRAGTHSVKTRMTVHGTTKKALKQKGSGGSRHGSKKAPIYRGGGVAHGPHPRNYSYTVPKKVRAAALRSAITTRASAGDLVVIDQFAFAAPKTKEALAILGRLGTAKALVVTADEQSNLHLSIRNLKTSKYIRAEGVNVFDVLKYDKLILTVDAAKALETRLA